MTLNWSTLALEIINFILLMWLLQHYLYRPVQRLLEQRQSAITQTLLDAEQHHQRAEALRLDYQNKIQAWQQQQQHARAQLQLELESSRKEALAQQQQSLLQAREKEQVLLERQRQQQRQQDQQQALSNGSRFASQLLQHCAGPELEQRLIDLFIQRLEALPEPLRQALRREPSTTPCIQTTQRLSDSQRSALQQQLERLLQAPRSWTEELSPPLIAGIRITLGGYLLGANIADELQAFAEISPHPEHADAD